MSRTFQKYIHKIHAYIFWAKIEAKYLSEWNLPFTGRGEHPIEKIGGGYGVYFWPYFVAHVTDSRDAVIDLTTTARGEYATFYHDHAIHALAEKWPDESTKELLGTYAVRHKTMSARSAAIQELAKSWPDEATRKLLEECAIQHESTHTRCAALEALGNKWPDETTRKLLTERAVQDENEYPRRTALEALVDRWPGETSRKLLTDRARLDGVAASVLGRQHSEFGRLVFTRDLDGRSPYLDPAKPLPREHIERAAAKAHVPADKIDETVRSLSAHLGWDITRGANPGPTSQ